MKNEGSKKSVSMKIRLSVKDKTITATLIDCKTTRDFISLLPLTLTLKDLFHREKFAHLPKTISTEGKRANTYEVGSTSVSSAPKPTSPTEVRFHEVRQTGDEKLQVGPLGYGQMMRMEAKANDFVQRGTGN